LVPNITSKLTQPEGAVGADCQFHLHAFHTAATYARMQLADFNYDIIWSGWH
jgi:hypothetical protein